MLKEGSIPVESVNFVKTPSTTVELNDDEFDDFVSLASELLDHMDVTCLYHNVSAEGLPVKLEEL